ncbi:MAG TPA: hypothetical protein VMH50_14855 [Thermoleophilia bacterium]|nr:hypothetical protein [Thermoleophilia bacterium]
MKTSSIAIRRPAGLGLLGLALVLALSLLVLAVAPQARAANVRLDGVRTALTTDPGTTSTLFGAGLIPLPIAPSSIAPTSDAARFTFPVTGGKVDAKTLAGSIRHSGGILLAQRDGMGWKALSLAKFTINVTGSPNLTAVVNGGKRLAIADLDLGSAQIKKFTKGGRAFVSIKNVGVTLNTTAMGAVNGTFGTMLPDNVKLGTADVLARVAH